MESREYLIITNELQSLIDDNHQAIHDLIQKRANHEINRSDINELSDNIQNNIKFIHEMFVNDCYKIIDNILESHIFEMASSVNFEIIKEETQQALYHFVNTFKNDIRPTIIYEIIFNSEQSFDEKLNIKNGYLNNYLTIDTYGNVKQNIYYMKKYILELFGFDVLQINMQ
jgi:hypothetical protein